MFNGLQYTFYMTKNGITTNALTDTQFNLECFSPLFAKNISNLLKLNDWHLNTLTITFPKISVCF